jgi:hypothetical protein
VKLTKGDFASALADDGLTANSPGGTKATLPVTVIYNGISFQKAVSVTNTGKQWQFAKEK